MTEKKNEEKNPPPHPIWKRNKYLALLNDWAGNSTCFDGIPSIGKAEEWFWKLIWIVVFLGMTGYCTYSLIIYLDDYFQYDITTEISIERLASIQFPTVTFCNKNAYKLASKLNSVIMDTNARTTWWINTGYDSMSVMSGADYNVKLAPYYLNQSFDSFSNYSYNLDDMLIGCLFNNARCSNELFYHVYTTNYGNCYQVSKLNPSLVVVFE